MLGRHKILKTAIKGWVGSEPVSVRETYWGYVIRSANPDGKGVAGPVLKFLTVTVWMAALALWLLPGAILPLPGFIWKAFFSVALLAAFYFCVIVLKKTRGYEVQVDVNRRELRVGVVTRKGDCWIRSSKRFDEVGKGVFRRADRRGAMHSLCLRMKDVAELVPVAVGDEATLLAVHDRLMRDLRPIEEKMSAIALGAVPRMSRAQSVFPRLGPDEIAV